MGWYVTKSFSNKLPPGSRKWRVSSWAGKTCFRNRLGVCDSGSVLPDRSATWAGLEDRDGYRAR